MKRTALILIGFMILSISQLSAQQYSASGYWNMEHDPLYVKLLERQTKGDSLSIEEQKTLSDYKTKLSDYFEKMSDEEKSVYYKNRKQWAAQPETISKPVTQQLQQQQQRQQLQTDIYSGERSMFSQYLVANGIFGALYGGATSYILGIEDGGVVAGITLLSAGASVLVPILSIKDKYVSYNSLALSIHGKAIGALQGVALGALITGNNVDDGKLIVALATASSIGLGRLGYSLGKNKPWTEGRVALYSYYGFLMPLEGLALDDAFQIEDPRVIGLTSLAFGAGGYLIADKVAQRYDFTKGDVTAITTLASLNGLVGLWAFADIMENNDASSAAILIPAAGALGATLGGQLWMKDARLSNQQGRNVALATAGGSVMGLGLTALFSPESQTPYYISAYITGMSAYAALVSIYKKQNRSAISQIEKRTGWNFNIMPQNIFLNKKIAPYALSNPGKRIDFLPAFSATLKF